ncbi:MAG: dephospho-CoA kinase [Deltaproteobacteria bacterium]|nr:MAG: dephospho-CoA kinase [Deltaproteobacteria bacterium]PIE73126.1 MAG: dephospho-CoA kinase [Deltaproteobacteria bacterium]
MTVIGVTGGYGSGKSSVGRALACCLDAELVDSDRLCREFLLPEQQGYQGLVAMFGERFLDGDGLLDRAKLRRAVFTDSAVKDGLESILHPLVRESILLVARTCLKKGRFLVAEVPLLFETGWQNDFQITLLVRTDPELSAKRGARRDRVEVAEARQIISQQMPLSDKEMLADFIVDNNGLFVSTMQQLAWCTGSIFAKLANKK